MSSQGSHVCPSAADPQQNWANILKHTGLPANAIHPKHFIQASEAAQAAGGQYIMRHAVSGNRAQVDPDMIVEAMQKGYIFPTQSGEWVADVGGHKYRVDTPPAQISSPPQSLLEAMAQVNGLANFDGAPVFRPGSTESKHTHDPVPLAYDIGHHELDFWEMGGGGSITGIEGQEYVVGESYIAMRTRSSLRARGGKVQAGRAYQLAAQMYKSGKWQIIPTANGAELHEVRAGVRAKMIAKVIVGGGGKLIIQDEKGDGNPSPESVGALCGWMSLPSNTDTIQAANAGAFPDASALPPNTNPIHADWNKPDYVLGDTFRLCASELSRRRGVAVAQETIWDTCIHCGNAPGTAHQCPVLYARPSPDPLVDYFARPGGPTEVAVAPPATDDIDQLFRSMGFEPVGGSPPYRWRHREAVAAQELAAIDRRKGQ